MANPEHLEILQRGVKAWNTWRKENPLIIPNLSSAQLSYLNYRNINFSQANLFDASIYDANLSGASLIFANLSFTDLNTTTFRGADLRGANLTNANVRYTNLTKANLRNAVFAGADLSGSDFTQAVMGGTYFGDGFLDRCIGLDKVNHSGPSSLGIDVIYHSKGTLPEAFLRGCGLPEDFIVYVRSLTAQAIDFYSCFISYSSKDEDFATRLHADLQSKGVRVWFAPHDMRVGAKLRPAIDESIKVYDKLLLVLSGNSVGSQWVEQEVETALAKEREQEREVLFPVRLDDVVLGIKTGWPALIKNSRHIGDFTHWKRHDLYKEAFERLLRDLKAEA